MLKSLTRCLLLIPAVADVKIPTTEIADGVHMPVMSIGMGGLETSNASSGGGGGEEEEEEEEGEEEEEEEGDLGDVDG
ncbi:unnamed protein product [Effrenium voratum]|nr:unnamed protein product [Effrenium voratum]